MNDFLPLSDIQKRFTFTPIKTYRLFRKYAAQNKLQEGIDWLMRDKQIVIDVRKFYTLLETQGYKNFTRDDQKRNQVKSDEIKRNQVISNEITEDKKSEEVPSPEPEKVKSSDFTRNQMKSDEITSDQKPTSQPEHMPKDPTLERELINTLRESLARSEQEAETLREIVRNFSTQNTDLTRQNVQLTYILTAPKQRDEREEEERKPPRTYRESVYESEPIYASAAQSDAQQEPPAAPEYRDQEPDIDIESEYEHASPRDAINEGDATENAKEIDREDAREDTREESHIEPPTDAPTYPEEPITRRDESFTPDVPNTPNRNQNAENGDATNEQQRTDHPDNHEAFRPSEHNAYQPTEHSAQPEAPHTPDNPDIPRRLFVTPEPTPVQPPPPSTSPESPDQSW